MQLSFKFLEPAYVIVALEPRKSVEMEFIVNMSSKKASMISLSKHLSYAP